MEAGTSYLTRTELLDLSGGERMAYLREQWGMSEDVIYGRLVERTLAGGGSVWILAGATNAQGQPLEYPVADWPERFDDLQGWAHIGRKPRDCAKGDKVRGAFTLAPEHVRRQKSNPVAIGVIEGSVETLREVGSEDVRFEADGTLNLPDTLAQHHLERVRPDLLREHDELQASHHALQEEHGLAAARTAELLRQQRETEDAVTQAEAAAKAARGDEKRARRREQSVVKRIRERAEKMRLDEARKTLEEIKQFERVEREALDRKLAFHETHLREMHEQTERLRAYVRSHADRLVRLDLITDDQWRDVVGESRADAEPAGTGMPEVSGLEEGWAGVIPRVQRYLFDQGIVYPRALLESYLAVILTGDLVVLSGLSGSGKSQLVRAFAHATGGVAHMVPVKPNWTSSEDLMGYYNPMERAYLTTQFLDAIIAAARDPDRMHYVCLDEMNLARVEYYFADFLSAMETRGDSLPTIQLYSDEEAGHVAAEFRAFVDVLEGTEAGLEGLDLGGLLREDEIAIQLKERLGIGDGESLIQLHGRLRRMVSGVLNVPSQLTIPPNVRVVGAVNVDETTHALAPKVLDRAHVLRFGSPLDEWGRVAEEVASSEVPGERVFLPASALSRSEYPRFDPNSEDGVTQALTRWRRDYFVPLGLDFGLRTARQALAYRKALSAVGGLDGSVLDATALVHVVRQKVLPRFTFDGSLPPRSRSQAVGSDIKEGLEVVDLFRDDIKSLGPVGPYDVSVELEGLLVQARSDRARGIFNYWA